MDKIIAQIHDLVSGADDAGRKSIQTALMKLQHSLETPYETMMRLYNLHFQIAVTRVAVDLGFFTALSESKEPLTVDHLAKKSGAAHQLSGRILRYLASLNMIDETDQDTFTANEITRRLAEPNREGGIHLSFDICGPVTQALPDFLLETKHQNIVSNTNTPFNKAWNTPLSCWSWFPQQPQFLGHLHKALQIQYGGHWLSKFPIQEYLKDWTAQTGDGKVLFVDIGGSMGIQCKRLKEAYPNLQGKIILQDMKEAIDMVTPIEGVDIMAQDFFQPQAIKGAKFYYFRNIFHDYPDEKCLSILQNLIPALGKDSLILIDDKILPNKGVHRNSTLLDIAMMAQVGSLERTKDQWHQLLEGQGGCKILDMVSYTDEDDYVLVVSRGNSR